MGLVERIVIELNSLKWSVTEWFLLFSAWIKTKEFNLESAVLLFSLDQFKAKVIH